MTLARFNRCYARRRENCRVSDGWHEKQVVRFTTSGWERAASSMVRQSRRHKRKDVGKGQGGGVAIRWARQNKLMTIDVERPSLPLPPSPSKD
jgi:hypothetical protein